MPLGRLALDDHVEGPLLVTVLPLVHRPYDTRPKSTSMTPGPTTENDEQQEDDRGRGVQDTEQRL